ncbi:hypothetical protein [Methylobacterium sp. 1973]|uniref:hypothetical protein n=1 Tax=Methylobacterium sp. 1973 TaxID=3156421 RepID=UPI00339A7D56
MSDGSQVYAKASPSTLASVTKDLGDTRSRMDDAATAIEALADKLSGAVPAGADTSSLNASAQPAGSVAVLAALVGGLATPAMRIELAVSRIQSAIG